MTHLSILMRGSLATALLLAALPVRGEDTPEERKRVDDSIARALSFLAKTQQANGCWKLDGFGESTAGTSLAVMAFLAAGHVPSEGPYGTTIDRGIRWVLDHQQDNGMLIERTSHGPMYDHGISTLMLAEVVGMCDRKTADDVRKALTSATRLILKAQNVAKPNQHAGGWRYNHTSNDSDLSVTGWQLLALRAAKGCGCDVPAENIEAAVSYVKRCGRDGRGFGYMPGAQGTPTLTGVGILALEVCGEHRDEMSLSGAQFLMDRPLNTRDNYFYYGVYYCSVGLFKVGGRHWDEGHRHLRDILLSTQENEGSWQSRGAEANAGRIYCTAMSVLALAVEYQYLPIYQR
ncbi:MAG: terpene cyclase/mutase family protein [Planctomycetaceae bacterium]|nr:terpene cyclase/mutase family protein [Planctomycetaceae bacterium]